MSKSIPKDGFVYLKVQILGIFIFQLKKLGMKFTIPSDTYNSNQLTACNILIQSKNPEIRDLHKATVPKTSKVTLFFIKTNQKIQKTYWSTKQ